MQAGQRRFPEECGASPAYTSRAFSIEPSRACMIEELSSCPCYKTAGPSQPVTLAGMERRPLAVVMAIAVAFEGAELRFFLGKQLFDHRPLARVGFRRE